MCSQSPRPLLTATVWAFAVVVWHVELCLSRSFPSCPSVLCLPYLPSLPAQRWWLGHVLEHVGMPSMTVPPNAVAQSTPLFICDPRVLPSFMLHSLSFLHIHLQRACLRPAVLIGRISGVWGTLSPAFWEIQLQNIISLTCFIPFWILLKNTYSYTQRVHVEQLSSLYSMAIASPCAIFQKVRGMIIL